MKTVEYGTYVIDLTAAMLEHRNRLTEEQAEQIETVHKRAIQFVTEFLQHENADLDTLLSYLNHDALSPVTIIIGSAEVMVMGMLGKMPKPFMDAIEEIRECGYLLRDDLYDMQRELIEFMESIGMQHQPRAKKKRKKVRQAS